jgi:NAD(P)-dependent dehydrogenase (short-subunit alcohol dehydrogenase family)
MENQLILCTGGNGGIGFETVKELVSRGAHVIIAARNQLKNEECVAKIKESLPSDCRGNVSSVRLDLSDLHSIVHTVNELKSRYPGRAIDQLIQNAGGIMMKSLFFILVCPRDLADLVFGFSSRI